MTEQKHYHAWQAAQHCDHAHRTARSAIACGVRQGWHRYSGIGRGPIDLDAVPCRESHTRRAWR